MTDGQLSLEDVVRYPRPGMSTPNNLAFTPDSQQITYLLSTADSSSQELWTYTLSNRQRRQRTNLTGSSTDASGQQSLDEELRRQRNRQRAQGVTSYQMVQPAEGTPLLLIPFDGQLYSARGEEHVRPLTGCEGAIDARLSPDGSHVAFVRSGEMYLVPSDGTAQPRVITSGATEGITNGLAEYIAQQEMERQEGYWWSPDSTQLAFVRVDSRHIPVYPIVHQGTEHVVVEKHRYPFAGMHNAVVQLGIVGVDAHPEDEVTWMDLGPDDDIYLARVAWQPDGVLTALIQSRDQCTQRLVAFDTKSGAATTLIEEQGHPWLNLHDDLRFLRSGEFIWSSEQTGFRHLALYDHEGHKIRTLTEGSWMVTGQVAVDEERHLVYFQGTKEGPLERHLYVVSLEGGPARRLTEEAGWHDVVISSDRRFFVDTWQSPTQPPRLTVRRLTDETEHDLLFESQGITPASLGLCVPELTSFHTSDGTQLYAAVYASEQTRTSGQPRPLVVFVYGGPHAQTVTSSWSLTVDMRAQYMARHGFVVLKVDNRGSANRGLAFESAIARSMGQIEVDDQVEGVRFLASRPYVDPERVGISGWSYGGYMVCRALMRAPEVFKVGISGAPVTFFEGYDTHYTERYMGHPDENAAGYLTSSVLPDAEKLVGKLLLVHGLVDENVHARHSMRLIEALGLVGRDYELMLFPEARHMPHNHAHLKYMEQRLVEFLRRTLEHA